MTLEEMLTVLKTKELTEDEKKIAEQIEAELLADDAEDEVTAHQWRDQATAELTKILQTHDH